MLFPLKAMDVKKSMSAELQALKQELQQKGSQDRQHDEDLITAMKEQVSTRNTGVTLFLSKIWLNGC